MKIYQQINLHLKVIYGQIYYQMKLMLLIENILKYNHNQEYMQNYNIF
jgi:hypothetical protein